MPDELQGRTVALLIAPQGTEEPEFSEPKKAVEGAGATVHVVSTEAGEVQTVNNDLELRRLLHCRQNFQRGLGGRLRRARHSGRDGRRGQAARQSRSGGLYPLVFRAGQTGWCDLSRGPGP